MLHILQTVKGRWKELKQFLLQNSIGTPEGAVESSFWYDTTTKEPMYMDDTGPQGFGRKNLHAGIVGDYPVITNSTGGQVICGPCRVSIFDNSESVGIPKVYDVAQKTLTLTDGASQLIAITFNGGAPEYTLLDSWDISAYDLSSDIILERKYYAFGDIHTTEFAYKSSDLPRLLALRVGQTEPYARVGGIGLEPSTDGLTVVVSGAYVWSGPKQVLVYPFTSATDKMEILYKDANGFWISTIATQLNNTQYNPDGVGLATLNNNWATVTWLYRTIGDDKEVYAVMDNQQYNNIESATVNAKPRTGLPAVVTEHCVLVGRAIITKDSTTVTIESAWDKQFSGGGITVHNNLSQIQGGTTGEYYHDNLIQHSQKVNAGGANGFALLDSTGRLPSSQLPSYVDDVLEYTSKALFPVTGESGKIYVDLTTNLTWRWSGSTYVEISPSLALGETSATAYRGDRGKIAYDHSQTTGNPHNTAPTDISGLSTYVDGRITAVAEPKYTNYSRSVTTNEWWQGIGFRVHKTSAYGYSSGLIEIICYNGVDAAVAYSAIIHVMVKNQNNTYSSVVQEIAGGSLARGNIRYWVEDTGSSYTVWIIPYLAAYVTCNIKVMSSFNSLGETLSTQTSTSSYTGVLPVAGEQFVTQNDGQYGDAKLASVKDGYYGLSLPGSRSVRLMSGQSNGAAGIYDKTDEKWILLKYQNSGIETGYTPSINSDSGEIPTTAWVKDVAPQVSTGFSPNTKMIYCAAYERGTDVNTLYFCY